MDHDGSQPPRASDDTPGRELAFAYAPQILFADEEPFLPLVAGYTVFHDEADSPSSRWRVKRTDRPAWATAIEYAIWWDWDIGHLYELEHVWSYVDARGELVWAEASFHGLFGAMIREDDSIPHTGTHPVLYSQPGKHGFALTPHWFRMFRDYVANEAGAKAGEGGVLVKDEYRDRIPKTPEHDALAAAYLQKLAFVPSLRFSRRFSFERELLIPWPALDAWIPARVNWWLDRLRG